MKTDIWHVGFIRRPVADIVQAAPPEAEDIVWLPPQGAYRFIADPFGLKTAEGFTVFVEAYDYRTKCGEIHYYSYDQDDDLTGQGVALATGSHLSYPYLIRDGGKVYMLPEAYKSGALTLYEATHFPDQWTPVATLLDEPAIDATVTFYQDRWWMFYAVAGPDGLAMRQLHIAYADQLRGPWHKHAANPVHEGYETSRPGGNPILKDGVLYLPVQDCVASYGAAINILRIDTLTPEAFKATPVSRLEPEGLLEGFEDGLHTLSGDADITLIDVKQIKNSAMGHLIKLQYKWRKLTGAA
jgi:hypothetical protein